MGGGGQLTVQIDVDESYAEALEALCNGQAQAVSLSAMAYLAASERGCGEALYVLEQNDAIFTQGQLLADGRTAVFILEGFRQRTFCRPDPTSVNGWIIPSVTLKARGIDPFSDLSDVIDAGSDEDVVRMIYNGQCEVGATRFGAEEDVRLAEPERIIFVESLTPVPNDVVVISSKLDELTRAMIVDMLALHVEETADLLGADAMRAADDGMFADLRALFLSAGFSAAALGE